jgi:hypothetical protein
VKKIHFKPILVLGMILLINLAACTNPTVQPTISTSIPTETTTQVTNLLATPYSQQPAAGICASFDGQVVTVSLNSDLPDPRCAKVKADQTLTVLNNTQNTLSIAIGRFTSNLAVGEKMTIDIPFGDYLAPGVHQLQVSPCCGAELWLEETK